MEGALTILAVVLLIFVVRQLRQPAKGNPPGGSGGFLHSWTDAPYDLGVVGLIFVVRQLR